MILTWTLAPTDQNPLAPPHYIRRRQPPIAGRLLRSSSKRDNTLSKTCRGRGLVQKRAVLDLGWCVARRLSAVHGILAGTRAIQLPPLNALH